MRAGFYTDCHTHRERIPEGQLAIRNLFLHEVDDLLDGPVSIGLHPWFTGGVDLALMAGKLEALLQDKRVVAVGEIGLDRMRGASLDVQLEAFRMQASLAAKYDKPVILHVVKAIPEIIRLHAGYVPQRPWVLHGFNLGLDKAKALLEAGLMLSFGADIMQPAGPAATALALCPDGRFLLETDTWPGDLRLIFDMAASIRVRLPESFRQEVAQTYHDVFRFA